MKILKILLALSILATSLSALLMVLGLFLADLGANDRAVFIMSLLLIVFWVGIFGLVSYKFRDYFKEKFSALPGSWQNKFFIFAVLLALVEEGIAVSLTNLAPFFGGEAGQAFITASTNYFEVIFFATVIVFLPAFWVWSHLLSKYDFKPYEVLVLFGLTGWLAEMLVLGEGYNFFLVFWILVYGLMLYLPAYCLPKRNLLNPPTVLYFEAIILPLILALPVVLFLSLVKGWFDIELFVL